jgi:hypothetical protein
LLHVCIFYLFIALFDLNETPLGTTWSSIVRLHDGITWILVCLQIGLELSRYIRVGR